MLNMNDIPSDPFGGMAGVDLSWNTVPSPKPAEESEEESEDPDKSSLDDLDSLIG